MISPQCIGFGVFFYHDDYFCVLIGVDGRYRIEHSYTGNFG